MEFFNLVLAFAVLTGPLWLILLLLPVCIWLAVKLSRRFKPGVPRLAGGVGLFFLLFALPFADEIVGRVYLNYLCATQAGVKVYQTVELPAEYWDEQGRARFYDKKNGNFNLEGHGVEYRAGVYSLAFHIDNAGYKRVDKQSGQVLGEVTDFMYWGGWMRRNLSPSNTAIICEGGMERSNSLITQIFKPKKS